MSRGDEDPGIRLLSNGRRFAFHGPLDSVGVHRHAADAVVVGLSERFRVRHSGGASPWTRLAVIPVGVAHSLEIGQEPIAVFYLPFGRNIAALAGRHPPRVVEAWVELGRALGGGAVTDFSAIDRQAARLAEWSPTRVDARLERGLGFLEANLGENAAVEASARSAALSPSRMMALSRESLGVALRHLRRWLRTQAVVASYSSGRSLTDAALEAGFNSSAHLSAVFRELFGVPPSWVLRRATRPHIALVS